MHKNTKRIQEVLQRGPAELTLLLSCRRIIKTLGSIGNDLQIAAALTTARLLINVWFIPGKDRWMKATQLNANGAYSLDETFHENKNRRN